MPETARTLQNRPRPPRRGVYFALVSVEMKNEGYSEKPITRERALNEEELKTVNFTLDQFLKKKAKPFRVVKLGHNAAGTMKRRVFTHYVENKISKTRYEERPLDRSYVAAAKLCYTDDDGYTSDDQGQKMKPWVHIVCHDGSQADVWTAKRRGPRG